MKRAEGVRELAARGLCVREIAEELGCSASNVYSLVKRHGISVSRARIGRPRRVVSSDPDREADLAANARHAAAYRERKRAVRKDWEARRLAEIAAAATEADREALRAAGVLPRVAPDSVKPFDPDEFFG